MKLYVDFLSFLKVGSQLKWQLLREPFPNYLAYNSPLLLASHSLSYN